MSKSKLHNVPTESLNPVTWWRQRRDRQHEKQVQHVKDLVEQRVLTNPDITPQEMLQIIHPKQRKAFTEDQIRNMTNYISSVKVAIHKSMKGRQVCYKVFPNNYIASVVCRDTEEGLFEMLASCKHHKPNMLVENMTFADVAQALENIEALPSLFSLQVENIETELEKAFDFILGDDVSAADDTKSKHESSNPYAVEPNPARSTAPER